MKQFTAYLFSLITLIIICTGCKDIKNGYYAQKSDIYPIRDSINSLNKKVSALIKGLEAISIDTALRSKTLIVDYKKLIELNKNLTQPDWILVGKVENVVRESNNEYTITFSYNYYGGTQFMQNISKTTFPLTKGQKVEIRRYSPTYPEGNYLFVLSPKI